MPFLVALVAFLVIPVLLIIGARITDFSIAAADSVTATSSALLCKWGALRMCHFCEQSLAIFIQDMQGLLTIIGITIVTCSEIVLKIHLEVAVMRSTLANEGI
jgi:hypothetical protein